MKIEKIARFSSGFYCSLDRFEDIHMLILNRDMILLQRWVGATLELPKVKVAASQEGHDGS